MGRLLGGRGAMGPGTASVVSIRGPAVPLPRSGRPPRCTISFKGEWLRRGRNVPPKFWPIPPEPREDYPKIAADSNLILRATNKRRRTMDDQATYRQRLAGLLGEIAVEEGLQATHIQGVHAFRSSQSVPRAPMVYRPHIIIVGQGRKRAYLGGEVYQYDPAHYLVLAVPLPAECDAEAGPGEPVLMVTIDVDATLVGEMLLEMDDSLAPPGGTPRGISSTPMTAELGGAVVRLLECLQCPVDSRLLGRQMVREVVYRVLRGEQGGALRALASRDDHFPRIARVLRYIHSEYAKPLDVEE